MNRNTDIDFARCILILEVVLIHIVNFGELYPEAKAVILSFLMPTFLLITGYLVNVEKTPKQFGRYLLCLFLPYALMVTGFSVLSYFLPVQDRMTELSVGAVLEKVFVTSIGPYWFLQTMMVCGALYYACFRWLRPRMPLVAVLLVFGLLLAVVAKATPVLYFDAIPYYYIGVVLRQTRTSYAAFFPKTGWAIVPMSVLLFYCGVREWGSIGILAVVWCAISLMSWLNGVVSRWRVHRHLLYIGANTLPIYLFHPIFTMLAKFYLPLFRFDPTGLLHTLFTLLLAIAGGLLLARLMEVTRLAYIFGKPTLLRS